MRAVSLLSLVLLTAVGLAGCGDVGDQDKDDDGLYDRTERRGWPVTVDYLTQRVRYDTTSETGEADTDGDGIPDGDEFQFGTDPRKGDTDGDGLSDCQEVRHSVLAQCEDDSFHGPFDGGINSPNNPDPSRADSDPGVSPYVLEHGFTDTSGTLPNGIPEAGDGIPDGEELAGYTITLANGVTRTVRTDPRNGDSDDDRLDDGDERFTYQSDPTVRDTDGDGCEDGLDPVPSREERFRPGFGNLTLLRSTGSQPGGDVAVTVSLVNLVFSAPASGSTRLEAGQSASLAGHEPAAAHSDQCTFSPRSWIPVFASAVDQDGGQAVQLDLASQNPNAEGNPVAVAYWQVHTGRLSWAADGSDSWPVAEGVTFAGADASLALRPTLE